MVAIDIIILLLLFGLLYKLASKQYSMSLRVLLALGVGTAFGVYVRTVTPSALSSSLECILSVVGYGYLSLLKMLVIPLILTSIIHAIVNLGANDNQVLRKLSFWTCGMLLGMTAIASLIALGVGELFSVGNGMQLPTMQVTPKLEYTGFAATLLGMIPSNPIAIMAKENTVAIVIFAVLLGLAARSLDSVDEDKMMTFKNLIMSLFAIVKKLATLVLRLTPYAILSLMALMFIKQGVSLLSGVLNFMAAMYVAMLLVLAMHSLVLLFFGYNPIKYFKLAAPALLVAGTTRSSFGTLPVTEEILRNKFKTHQVIASFTPSIGATLGMNACAGVYPAMLAIMALHILHQPLTLPLIITIMGVNAIASLGISGIPGTAFVAATVSLTSLNLPYAVIALVQGVDPIIDMGRTAVNINGTMTTALVAERVMGNTIDEDKSELEAAAAAN